VLDAAVDQEPAGDEPSVRLDDLGGVIASEDAIDDPHGEVLSGAVERAMRPL
jgi:hypothetical protein